MVAPLLLGVDVQPSTLFAVALINTRPDRGGGEGLESTTYLHRIGQDVGVYYTPEGTGAELLALRRLRVQIDEIVKTEDLAARFVMINALFVSSSAIPQIVTHAHDLNPHFHYTLPDASYVDQIKGITTYGLARLIIMGEFSRLKTCDGGVCNRLFLDLTRNNIRRYCDSRTCGNRTHAARYRARKADEIATEAEIPPAGAVPGPPPRRRSRLLGSDGREHPLEARVDVLELAHPGRQQPVHSTARHLLLE